MIEGNHSMTIYYVYAYLRKDNTPYYIGKGHSNRCYSKDHQINLPADINRIVFLETRLSEIGALALERRYILWYGRKDLGTGILRNLTDGGEGVSGRVTSNATKKKISMSQKGIPRKPHSEETKSKMRESHKYRSPDSEETRLKKSVARKGKPSVMKDKKFSEKAKQNMRVPKKTARSEEHKKKLGEAVRKAVELRRIQQIHM
jgi:hypothetical protein